MRLDTLPNLNLDPCRVEFLGPLREILESTLTPPSPKRPKTRPLHRSTHPKRVYCRPGTYVDSRLYRATAVVRPPPRNTPQSADRPHACRECTPCHAPAMRLPHAPAVRLLSIPQQTSLFCRPDCSRMTVFTPNLIHFRPSTIRMTRCSSHNSRCKCPRLRGDKGATSCEASTTMSATTSSAPAATMAA